MVEDVGFDILPVPASLQEEDVGAAGIHTQEFGVFTGVEMSVSPESCRFLERRVAGNLQRDERPISETQLGLPRRREGITPIEFYLCIRLR